jgi:hypothetical protein
MRFPMNWKQLAVPSLFLSLSLVGCGEGMEGLTPSDSLATTEQATHSWGGYHWARTSNPFTVKLGSNVTSAWSSYLSTASTDWSKSTVLDTTVVAGAGLRRCGAVAGRVEVCNDTYGSNGWLGLASIWLSSGHISQGTVKLNDTYYASTKYNTPAWRASVMCQEVGHTFGLAHNDEDFSTINGTCMDYANDPTQNQHPNAHDYDMLASIYSHLDSTTTIQTTNPPSAGAMIPPVLDNADERSAWGEHVATSPNGRAEIYVRQMGDWTLVTEVTRVLPND